MRGQELFQFIQPLTIAFRCHRWLSGGDAKAVEAHYFFNPLRADASVETRRMPPMLCPASRTLPLGA